MKYRKKLNNISELISFVWDNPFSNFYKEKYKKSGFTKESAIKNFENLPFLTRKELQSTSLHKRIFTPREDVDFIAYTSGTSSGTPLLMNHSKVENYYFKPTLGLDIKNILVVHPPLLKSFSHTFIQQAKQDNTKPTLIFGDINNLVNNTILANETNTDAIYATPTIASLLIDPLKKYYDIEKVKLLALCSETLTKSGRRYLETNYPNAKIADLYGSSELGQFILYPCKKILEQKINYYHIIHDAVLKTELIDNELVITFAQNLSMPLIRYKTGDFFNIVKENCDCGKEGPILEWLGRKDIDQIKIGGIEIKIEDIEKIMNPLMGDIGNHYQFHFKKEKGILKEKIKIILEIVNEKIRENESLSKKIKEKVKLYLLKNWQITPTSNLEKVLSTKIFSDIEIKFVEDLTHKSEKTKRLINHL